MALEIYGGGFNRENFQVETQFCESIAGLVSDAQQRAAENVKELTIRGKSLLIMLFEHNMSIPVNKKYYSGF